MDGRGRALDNVFIERLWRSVKYEEVYLRDYGSVSEAEKSLGAYFAFYNERRRHQRSAIARQPRSMPPETQAQALRGTTISEVSETN